MFQIQPLSTSQFNHLHGQSDEALKAQGILAEVANGPGFPCRVTLRDARPGERVLLLNYMHQPADTPFRASHAIYVIDCAEEIHLKPGELPPVFTGRILSLRAFGGDGLIKTADLCDGEKSGEMINAMLGRDDVGYVHIHYAKYGCYAAVARRV